MSRARCLFHNQCRTPSTPSPRLTTKAIKILGYSYVLVVPDDWPAPPLCEADDDDADEVPELALEGAVIVTGTVDNTDD